MEQDTVREINAGLMAVGDQQSDILDLGKMRALPVLLNRPQIYR